MNREYTMKKIIDIQQNVYYKNDEWAKKNREFFAMNNIYVLNLIGSPGCGKTTLLYNMIESLKDKINFAVIEGDVETDIDKMRLRQTGIYVEQINTHSSCHLNAEQINKIIGKMPLKDINCLIIENIGNLICPSAFELGEDIKVAVLSTAEGDEKPLKYPALFIISKVVIITKIDLLPYVDFSMENVTKHLKHINRKIEIFSLSSKTKEGFDLWIDYLLNCINKKV